MHFCRQRRGEPQSLMGWGSTAINLYIFAWFTQVAHKGSAALRADIYACCLPIAPPFLFYFIYLFFYFLFFIYILVKIPLPYSLIYRMGRTFQCQFGLAHRNQLYYKYSNKQVGFYVQDRIVVGIVGTFLRLVSVNSLSQILVIQANSSLYDIRQVFII